MRSVIPSRSMNRAAVLFLALLAIGACGRKKEQPVTDTASGAIVPTSGVQVTGVMLGRTVGPDKKVLRETDTFAKGDTIFASVHTIGSSSNSFLVARWIYQDGQVVNETSENISPTGDSYTEFHVAKPSGWPAGKYTVKILANGQEVQSKDFTVR
ncbi:MAG TPA: hypothetical protein VJO33_13445 [Gemmatimonadaceae bacterium]|nr:hypothetical protein [Gemmatimonadaceae bacterium]